MDKLSDERLVSKYLKEGDDQALERLIKRYLPLVFGFRGRVGTGIPDGTNFVVGEVISNDGQSVIVKLRDGGSKIVFYSDATEIGKFTDGNADNLAAGESITASGLANEDGSLTAQSIQIRPFLTPAPVE